MSKYYFSQRSYGMDRVRYLFRITGKNKRPFVTDNFGRFRSWRKSQAKTFENLLTIQCDFFVEVPELFVISIGAPL
jgi:hypothetical protein